ncbi:hypothetical protein NVP1022O_08 [Vibrio phage 1.022.O._10N.286.45.A10]|nr:hypothetical protein NVP1022O_08 [Vibrio phage 1.022.O._10N.286.45.A10]
MSMYTANLTPHIYDIVIDNITNQIYDFPVGKIHEPLPFFLDGAHFLDVNGLLVTPSAGTVTVKVSSDGVLFRDPVGGSISASTDPTGITPPSGQAPVAFVRISLSGIVGATGFRAKFVKGGE